MNIPDLITKLVAIRHDDQLGELQDQFSIALREINETHPIEATHAKLAAKDIGRVAAHLLNVDETEAVSLALEEIDPCPRLAVAVDLIDEFYSGTEHSKLHQNSIPKRAAKRRAW